MRGRKFLAYAQEQDANATINVSEDRAVVPSATAWQMGNFSSWGISPDLKL